MTRLHVRALRRTGLVLLAGMMVCTQAAAASDHILQVSVTLLPRIACQGTGKPDAQGPGRVVPVLAPSGSIPGDAAVRCRGTDPSVTYRVRSESDAAGSGGVAVFVVEP